MKKNFSLVLIALLLMLVLATGLIACDKTTYNVTFDLQDGSDPIVVTVESGNTAEAPSVENTAYKNFKGWYLDAEGTTKWDSAKVITSDLTVYACWTTQTAKITFKGNYPKSETKQLNLPKGEPLDMTIYVPERYGYLFNGWFKDAECTEAFAETDIITGNITLYAGWIADPDHVHEYAHTHKEMTCTKDGYDEYVCQCGDKYQDNVVPASGHSFDFEGLDYFSMVYCSNENCSTAGRRDSERIYDDDFVYNFTDEKAAEIEGRYDQMLTILSTIERYDADKHAYVKDSELYVENKAFEEIYNAYYDDIMYVIEQYQYAYVFYCVDESTFKEDYEKITDYRTNIVSDFYALYRLIHETKFRDYFFAEDEGWTEEDIQMALTMSDTYGGDEYVAINERISEIEVEFRGIKDASADASVPTLYAEFVSLKNQLAVLAGYDNYVEYAYPNEYSRDYTPQDVATMRGYVKQYLKNVYSKINGGYNTSKNKANPEAGTDAALYLAGLTDDSIFESKATTDLVQAYFRVMNSETAGDQVIDFYSKANELFMNGNYFTGGHNGAFNYWIPAQETSILYFGPGSYSGAFTFVHEFGHYYSDVYNGGVSLSYDLAETHSQGNEMMFLAFLEDYLDNDILRAIYDKVYYDNLWNMFAIIMLASAVDEFEYCVYTNTAPDGTPKTYAAKDYDKLFKDIMNSYGIAGSLNSSYWRYVVIEAPCYYISYAMSALPCVELLSVADTEGFEVAQDIYYKFFTFTDDPDNVEIDEVGDKVVTKGYAEILQYVGLNSIFDEALYQGLNSYFVTNQKDFSYPDAE